MSWIRHRSSERPKTTRTLTCCALVALAAVALGLPLPTTASSEPAPVVTEAVDLCGPDDLPETGIQGDIPKADQDSGRAADGYNCGLALVGHATLDAEGRSPTGNANMAWAGDCAYVAGPGAVFGPANPRPGHGVAVVDVSDPTRPEHIRTLRSEGSRSVLETLHAVETPDRAVLVVGQYGNDHWPTDPKPMDIYDVSDCTQPRLLETFHFPENIHNLTVSGNGRYVFATQPIQVLDIDPLFDDDPGTMSRFLGNLDGAIPAPPMSPSPVADLDDGLPEEIRGATRGQYISHEAWPTADGTKLYLGGQLPTYEVFTIVDIGRWLARDSRNRPLGPPKVISQRNGRGHSVRTATIEGPDGEPRPFVLHSEESVIGPTWGCLPEELNPLAGAAQPWLTDISDEANPVLVSQFGLEINDPVNCPAQMESGVSASVHYHDVDDPDDTTFVVASMWNSGLRVFDVRDPARPTEVAYFNPGDVDPGPEVTLDHAWGHVRYVPETGHIWFATSSGGFWVVEVEPQVREHLGLDDDGTAGAGPAVRHPLGRAGTRSVSSALRATPSVDVTPYYCTLGTLTPR